MTQEAPSVAALKAFLRETNTGAKDTYSFTLTDTDEIGARNFVQTMRAHLSRFRSQLRARGKSPAAFKMLASYAHADDGIIITLQRVTGNSDVPIARSLLKELDELGLTDEP